MAVFGAPTLRQKSGCFIFNDGSVSAHHVKYHHPRAYRVVLLDAGHLCQTFCLVATWLGLAPFCTAALKDTQIEKDLGIDGIRESVLYVAGVGLPVTAARVKR